MARIALTPISVPNGYADEFTAIAWEAATPAPDGNKFAASGLDLLLIRNTGASAHDVTLLSVALPRFGRTGDVTESIPAGEYRAFGPLPTLGWQQSDNAIYVDADDAEIELAVLALATS